MFNSGDVAISHFIPGRVRLKVAAIKGKPQLAEQLRAAFEQVPGLTGITYNTLTGSVLITYDIRRLLADDASARLKEVLRAQLPGLDAEQVVKWLHHPVL